MVQRKARPSLPVFLSVVVLGLVVFALGSLQAPAGDLSLQPARSENPHTGSSGDPGFPDGAPRCYLEWDGLNCYDAEGNEIPYHCGDMFVANGLDADVHDNNICDVEKVHCPAALVNARAKTLTACPTICPVFTETGAAWVGWCITNSYDLYTSCNAAVFGTCAEEQDR
ncbi:MAG: hypothetical protein HY369_04460 [Candidatus Aenigmarchaeota archaeon]|nr:hypothetical protein [Candidatus Aenigmarchaeota archaeon]